MVSVTGNVESDSLEVYVNNCKQPTTTTVQASDAGDYSVVDSHNSKTQRKTPRPGKNYVRLLEHIF